MNDKNKNEQKSSRFISLGACTVDAILKVDHIPSGDAKVMAEDGVVIGAGMAVAATEQVVKQPLGWRARGSRALTAHD